MTGLRLSLCTQVLALVQSAFCHSCKFCDQIVVWQLQQYMPVAAVARITDSRRSCVTVDCTHWHTHSLRLNSWTTKADPAVSAQADSDCRPTSQFRHNYSPRCLAKMIRYPTPPLTFSPRISAILITRPDWGWGQVPPVATLLLLCLACGQSNRLGTVWTRKQKSCIDTFMEDGKIRWWVDSKYDRLFQRRLPLPAFVTTINSA